MKQQSLFVLILTLLLTSCASYQTKYAKNVEDWSTLTPSDERQLLHTTYLVGDAGYSVNGKVAPVLAYLKNQIVNETEKSSILFLGDNVYQSGMPPKKDSLERLEAEFRIEAQLGIVDNFKGYPVFIPGNHDWRGWGARGLKRQQRYIQKYINEKRGIKDKDDYEDYFLPQNGCAGPEIVELNDDLVIIGIDSQWWMADWDKDNNINAGCELKNREHFKFEFENAVRKYRNKQVIIAMHHPLYSYGPHGGKSTLKQHLFPLTGFRPNLYIPIPIVGSLAAWVRGGIGSKQDIANKKYKDFIDALLAGVKKNGNFIFVSGHEHALQYIENEGQKFIVSGSGSKSSPVGMGKGSFFASSSMGYSKIHFYEGGEAWASFYEVSEDGKEAHLIYRKKIKDYNPKKQFETLEGLELKLAKNDSVLQYVTTKKPRPVGKFHEVIYGQHNRNLYQDKYYFKTLDLVSSKGGLVPVKLGGGNQTNSLRLEASDGREYVLRGLSKDVTRFLPSPFNEMDAAKFLVEDNFLSTNPFAPLSMPILADAINIYHTNPKLVYVPSQPALGEYNEVVGATMNLFEERPKGKKWKDAAFFGNADKIIGTDDVLEEILESNDTKVDEAWMLRTRLFDFIIGDWDRHDDQWAWAMIRKANGDKLLRPIPKDRDQAFSRYDGFITGLSRLTLPFLRQLQSFEPEVKNVKWTTWSARLMDRTFLNGLEWEDWKKQVLFIQENLRNEVIDDSFKNWPPEAAKLVSGRLKANIMARRDNLMNIAREHYEFVSATVNVIGTDEREQFVVNRINKFSTQVIGHHVGKNGELKEEIYKRRFDNNITKEINIYGNDKKDLFIVKGEATEGPIIRLIGGLGEDTFRNQSNLQFEQKRTFVYDNPGDQKEKLSSGFKDKRSENYYYNVYDRRSNDSNYDMATPFPFVGYNPDDGILAGFQMKMIKYGFKKEPYSSMQDIGASYSFGTDALDIDYRGDFINAFRPFDLLIETYYHGPKYSFNFSGIGNETERPVDDPDYYRVRQRSFYLSSSIKKRFAHNAASISLGPYMQVSSIEKTPNRYITSDDSELDEDVFDTMKFAGMKFALQFNNLDHSQAPHAGIRLLTNIDWVSRFQSSKQFATLEAQLAFFRALDSRENFIFATEIGTAFTIGSGYEFFQLPSIGDKKGLRGYRQERFYGTSSFWQTTDIRVELGNSINRVLPFTFGLFGSFDYGRVWEEKTSKRWHYNYGGGVWLTPMNALTLSVGLFIPKESKEESPRTTFGLGFNF